MADSTDCIRHNSVPFDLSSTVPVKLNVDGHFDLKKVLWNWIVDNPHRLQVMVRVRQMLVLLRDREFNLLAFVLEGVPIIDGWDPFICKDCKCSHIHPAFFCDQKSQLYRHWHILYVVFGLNIEVLEQCGRWWALFFMIVFHSGRPSKRNSETQRIIGNTWSFSFETTSLLNGNSNMVKTSNKTGVQYFIGGSTFVFKNLGSTVKRFCPVCCLRQLYVNMKDRLDILNMGLSPPSSRTSFGWFKASKRHRKKPLRTVQDHQDVLNFPST